MSGVYIKGMDMPTSCFECKLLDYTDAFKCRFRFESLAREHGINISRPSWCPLVPVPPHGDLIERDKLLNGDGVYLVSFQKSAIDTMKIIKAPTIIPAEEGE